MDGVDYLIVGAGVTGLAFANFVDSADYLIVERDEQPGGHCKTVRHEAGFVWDHSGHFFHFRDAGIERFLLDRLPGEAVVRVSKRAAVHYGGRRIDFPFQMNIHQLPQDEFIDCLHDLCFPSVPPGAGGLEAMLHARFGRGIAERFLIPYNEKVYATNLSSLDADALGRFFPQAGLDDVIRNFRRPGDRSYNATFTCARDGARQFIDALLAGVDRARLCCGESLESVDPEARVAVTSRRRLRFRRLISTIPFRCLLRSTGEAAAAERLSSSKVLVVNLGFDSKGDGSLHWLYFPEPRYPFYRVGYYDNLLQGERMSLYVESAYAAGAVIDLDQAFAGIMEGLREAGIVTGQALVAWHHVVMDPAYVHVTPESRAMYERYAREWAAHGIHSIGRYGGWKYCSMEDDMVEARSLAAALATGSAR